MIERALGRAERRRDLIERRAVESPLVEQARRCFQHLVDFHRRRVLAVEHVGRRAGQRLHVDAAEERRGGRARETVLEMIDDRVRHAQCERGVAAFADPAGRQHDPADDAEDRLRRHVRIAVADRSGADAVADEAFERSDVAAVLGLDDRALRVREIRDLAHHRCLRPLGRERAAHELLDAFQIVRAVLVCVRQVVRGELAGAQVALEDQVFAVLHVVVDGRARQADSLGDLVHRGCGDAARIELAGGFIEQHFALRRPGGRAGELRAARTRTPATSPPSFFLPLVLALVLTSSAATITERQIA